MEVKLTQLTKTFVDRKGKKTDAVLNMDLSIPSGKLVGLLGPSGCGKSTTLYMIAGLHQPTAGDIHFGGKRVTNLPPEQRGIGLVFQNYALYPHMTVRGNIMFPLENLKMPKEEALKACLEVAKLVDIDKLLDRKPKELSGGQQQRVAIARALVKNPNVLLLDEPLSNLDARLRLQTREEIKRIQKETGVTTIFVTHDQEEAMSISDEIVVMKDGVIQQIGAPQSVYENPINMFVAKFLGTPPINIFDGVVIKGTLYLGEDKKAPNFGKIEAEDGKVFVGIRPEFFTLDPKGICKAKIDYVEHIGRDKTLLLKFPQQTGTKKAIIPSSTFNLKDDDDVALSVSSFFVFDESGRRIK